MAEPRDPEASEPEHPWQTANVWVSGILAYLLPGAGHLYQGRRFKGVLYMVCILGTFFYGQSLADWKAVTYSRSAPGRQWGFLAQVGAGLPTLTAFWQSSRYEAQRIENGWDARDQHVLVDGIEGPLSERFDGRMFGAGDEVVDVSGRLELVPGVDNLGHPTVEGQFVGESADGKPVELAIKGSVDIGPEIYGHEKRRILLDADGDREPDAAGLVDRPFLNWYQVPLEPDAEQALHQQLGKTFELALVYTWIAGLLNILAIWDCIDGPAYGIGDEPEGDEAESGGEPAVAGSSPPAAPATT